MHNSYNLLPGTKALQVLWKRGNKVEATKVRARDDLESPAPAREPPDLGPRPLDSRPISAGRGPETNE